MIFDIEKGEKKLSLDVILAIIFFIYAFSGSTSSTYMYISYGLFFSWFFISMLKNSTKLITNMFRKEIVVFLLFLLYIFITGAIKSGIIEISKVLGLYFLYLTPLIVYLFYKNSLLKMKIILISVVLFIFILLIRSTVFFTNNPMAARYLASNETALGIVWFGGGYQFAYFAVLAFAFLLTLINRNNKFLINLLIISLLFSLTMLIISIKSTLTLIVLVIVLVLSLILPNRNQKPKSISLFNLVIYSFSIIGLIVFLFNIDNVAYYFISLENTGVVGERISQIGYFLVNDFSQSSYFFMRLEIPLKSINSFINSPIVGSGYKYGYIWVYSYPYIGGHGEWVDIFAIFGIVGSLLYFTSLFWQIKLVNKKNSGLLHVYLALFLLGMFNPVISIQVFLGIFFIFPAFENLRGGKKQ